MGCTGCTPWQSDMCDLSLLEVEVNNWYLWLLCQTHMIGWCTQATASKFESLLWAIKPILDVQQGMRVSII